MVKTIKEKIYEHIINDIGPDNPFTLDDLSNVLLDVKYSTLKVNVKRLIDQQVIKKTNNGMYYLPNPKRVLKKSVLNTDDVVYKKYLIDTNDNIIGYYSGINLANSLGLTTQTASVGTIFSNVVSNNKRTINIQNKKFIINSPRYKVTNENYKILQIFDIVDKFDKLSKIKKVNSIKIFNDYLEEVIIDRLELRNIIRSYPLETQITIYEMGLDHVITQE